MDADIPLTLQTTYAELLERSATADFEHSFERGTFVAKTVKGRKYWYFQAPTSENRRQRYVGPETPELLKRIAQARKGHDDLRERRTLVSTLVRSAFLPRPPEEIGNVVAALSSAGVFRLGAVLVGTVAFQTYSAMLGTRLPDAAARTDDIDIAQDRNVPIAVEDRTEPIVEILRKADADFRPIPALHRTAAFSYRNAKVRVDILTPNTGPDSDEPVRLRALGTDAQQLRFLDFLICDPEPAVLLHNGGVFVKVPAPERYAIHKLMVAERRTRGTGKSEKDLRQASALIAVLGRKRPDLIGTAWDEAVSRGKKWRQLLIAGLGKIHASVRDDFLRIVKETRSIIPGMDLRFEDAPARYDFSSDNIHFRGEAAGDVANFGITLAAMEDHFGATTSDKETLLRLFRTHRSEIERMAREKFIDWPIENPSMTTLKSNDVAKLRPRKGQRLRS